MYLQYLDTSKLLSCPITFIKYDLLFIELFIHTMWLIGIIYLLTFYDHLGAALADATPESSIFMKRIWNWSNNTKFDPDVTYTTTQIIKRAGYPAETHIIMTEDGYLLNLHRIPGGNGSSPVLLQHGLLSCSTDWIILGKGKALAYLLADRGYDVWLSNFRGNLYSRKHISLSPLDSTYWNFSFHEWGIYDLPAIITYITNVKSQKLHTYIGHSLGAGSFYIMASERPEIAQKVQRMISLAPAVFLNNMKGIVRYFVPFRRELKMMMQFFFHSEFFQADFLRFLFKFGCDQIITVEICHNLLSTIWGSDREQLNLALLPVIFNNFPSGTSAKVIMHFLQEIESGKFHQYDYGLKKNLLIYNSTEPPEYNLANITVPIALFYSNNDLLIVPEDVKRLYRILPNVVDMYEIPLPKFNHIDFIWAKDAPKLVYERIINLMKRRNFG